MAHEYTATRVVEFSETDLAGIVHFSHFFRWMESAEHEFVRSLGSTVHGESGGLSYGFVRAPRELRLHAPAALPGQGRGPPLGEGEDVEGVHLRVHVPACPRGG